MARPGPSTLRGNCTHQPAPDATPQDAPQITDLGPFYYLQQNNFRFGLPFACLWIHPVSDPCYAAMRLRQPVNERKSYAGGADTKMVWSPETFV